MYPLRTAGKGTFEWGANMARIWVHNPTVLAGKGFFHTVRLVAIFLKILKKKFQCLRKEMALFDKLGCHSAPQNPLFAPYKSPVSAATLRMCIFAIVVRFSR